jgi:hypothetical protein
MRRYEGSLDASKSRFKVASVGSLPRATSPKAACEKGQIGAADLKAIDLLRSRLMLC